MAAGGGRSISTTMQQRWNSIYPSPPHLQPRLQDGARLPLGRHVPVRRQPSSAVREAEGRRDSVSGGYCSAAGRGAGVPALLRQGDSL